MVHKRPTVLKAAVCHQAAWATWRTRLAVTPEFAQASCPADDALPYRQMLRTNMLLMLPKLAQGWRPTITRRPRASGLAHKKTPSLLKPSRHPRSRYTPLARILPRTIMDAFTHTVTIPTECEEPTLVVCREDTTLPPVENDSGRGTGGQCVIA
ncbi:hypothetical protein GGX14DRAFT_543543 [Mycena pura]|uniref:Uncharacterized protein n=1 Tax=Mycena pura TaxID=153505 RepID=A0AAD6YBW6_9AGAR|nr:hypothetical protein GGX14DRAFT_543543 [Mycena pura]